ncbi:MAG: hypothetical protein EB164_00845 [Thaumarchaeota archaeon]|nr:hypothetical protein [Nitrososphaerota archaeon]
MGQKDQDGGSKQNQRNQHQDEPKGSGDQRFKGTRQLGHHWFLLIQSTKTFLEPSTGTIQRQILNAFKNPFEEEF